MRNVFGTQQTWIVELRYASFSHEKSCQLCLCSAVPLVIGQLSWKLGGERESSPVERYFKLFWGIYVRDNFNLMPGKASNIGKAYSNPVRPDLARSSAVLGPYCKRRSFSLVEMPANKLYRNKQPDEFWPELKRFGGIETGTMPNPLPGSSTLTVVICEHG